jgi:hypothetical protein
MNANHESDPGTVLQFQLSLLRLGVAAQNPAPVEVAEARQLRELADRHRTPAS